MNKLINNGLTEANLKRIKQQYLGQITIANEQNEGRFLHFGKSVMYFNSFKTMDEIIARVGIITADELQEIAKEIFNPKQLSSLLLA